MGRRKTVKKNGNRKNPGGFVSASRSGDAFHYRWAARRSLLLLDQSSHLTRIKIEGDEFDDVQGEYSLDMIELYAPDAEYDRIGYQFKYSVRRIGTEMPLRELAKTFKGFAERHFDKNNSDKRQCYKIVSNRPVSKNLKKCVADIADGGEPSGRYAKAFPAACGLKGRELREFCRSIRFEDDEPDLGRLLWILKKDVGEYGVRNPTADFVQLLVDMISNKVLERAERRFVTVEDVLLRFCGKASSIQALYPAPPSFEPMGAWIKTSFYDALLDTVRHADKPVFIHAPGGVGKTATMRRLAADLRTNATTVIFDCFASGEYTDRLKLRHTAHSALVQMGNELAAKGLCKPIVVGDSELPQSVLQAFNHRIECALDVLRSGNQSARIYLLIDAADNARMAADGHQDECFVDMLLESSLPKGVTCVYSARTERLHKYWPRIRAEHFKILPFSIEETGIMLRRDYPQAGDEVVAALHARTSGFPRVIVGVLSDCNSMDDIVAEAALDRIDDYDQLLDRKFEACEKRYSEKYESRPFECVCQCLTVLPPNIPLRVLAAASAVDIEFVLSMIADFGIPLWLNDEYVHFRDEPTETWFRNRFGSRKVAWNAVIEAIRPLAIQDVYVAKVLPELLLSAGRHDELLRLANSDELLPESVSIAERKDLKLARVKFAVRAMLKSGRMCDGLKMSLTAAAESSASDRRQSFLLDHILKLPHLLSEDTVRKCAAERAFKFRWTGSENLCAGVLLSFFNDTKAMSQALCVSGERWLEMDIADLASDEERRRYGPDDYADEAVAFAILRLNAVGTTACAEWLQAWTDPNLRFAAARKIAGHLCAFERSSLAVDLFAASSDVCVALGMFSGIATAGCKLPDDVITGKIGLLKELDGLAIGDGGGDSGDLLDSIIGLCIRMLQVDNGRARILPVLSRHCLGHLRFYPFRDPIRGNGRYFLVQCLLAKLTGRGIEAKSIISEARSHYAMISDHDAQNLEKPVADLLRFYQRLVGLFVDAGSIPDVLKFAESACGSYDIGQADKSYVAYVALSSLIGKRQCSDDQILSVARVEVCMQYLTTEKVVNLAAMAFRSGRGDSVGEAFGKIAEASIASAASEIDNRPEMTARLYAHMAEAYYAYDKDDARAYFSKALESLSLAGEELSANWRMMIGLAKKVAVEHCDVSVEQTYNFCRGGEYVRKCIDSDAFDVREFFGALVDLNPRFAIATLSRWRDRRFVDFQKGMSWAIKICVEKDVMTPEQAWSFRGFSGSSFPLDLIDALWPHADSSTLKRKMVDFAESWMRKNGARQESWAKLFRYCNEIGYESPCRNPRTTSPTLTVKTMSKASNVFDVRPYADDTAWVCQAVAEVVSRYDVEDRWERFFAAIGNRNAVGFLRIFSEAEPLSTWDKTEVLNHIPGSWRDKAGVVEAMPDVLSKISFAMFRHGAIDGVEQVVAESAAWGCRDVVLDTFIRQVSNSRVLDGALYYQFISIASGKLNGRESLELFTHATEMVVTHIDDAFGDGCFSQAVVPVGKAGDHLFELIWTALGDFAATVRWGAIRTLANEFERNPEGSLQRFVECFEREDFSPNVSGKYPFYLHFARVGSLVALARVAHRIKSSLKGKIRPIGELLQREEHILIRAIGAYVLRNAGAGRPMVDCLDPVANIRLHVQRSWYEHSDVPCPIVNKAAKHGYYVVDYDFRKYWMSSALAVFGINRDHDELLEWVAAELRDSRYMDGYRDDPRQELYDREERNTSYDSGIPEESTYNFYLAYNGLMVLMTRLAQEMPVCVEPNNNENLLESFLKERLPFMYPDLSKWISDARDDLPADLFVREKSLEPLFSDALNVIDASRVLSLHGGDDSIAIQGHIEMNNGSKDFKCSISCALIRDKVARKTRTALSKMKDPLSFAFPIYYDTMHDDFRNHGPYDWRGLFDQEDAYPRYTMDEYDPYTAGLRVIKSFPSKKMLGPFKLVTAKDGLSWRDGMGRVVVKEFLIRSGVEYQRDTPGCDIAVCGFDKSLLDKICMRENAQLIFELHVRRRDHRWSMRYVPDEELHEEELYRYVLYSPRRGFY